jgi:hypothetical protein
LHNNIIGIVGAKKKNKFSLGWKNKRRRPGGFYIDQTVTNVNSFFIYLFFHISFYFKIKSQHVITHIHIDPYNIDRILKNNFDFDFIPPNQKFKKSLAG